MKKYESYMNSPFKVEGVEERSYISKSDEQLLENKDGELYVARKIDKSKIMTNDARAYTKVFIECKDIFMKLSGTTLKILMYGICTIRPLSQTVVYHIPDVQVSTEILSPNTIRTSLGELIEAGILAQKLGSNIEFWVNPNVFFNGNRLRIL